MNFISNLGLVLLTMVGYSTGRVLTGKKYHVSIELFDSLIIITLWIAALLLKFSNKWISILFWFLSGLLIGALITLGIRSNLSPAVKTSLKNDGGNIFKIIWRSWSAFALQMGNFQGRLMLLLFYFTIFAPFGIIYKFFRDSLLTKNSSRASFWIPLAKSDENIEDARRQF